MTALSVLALLAAAGFAGTTYYFVRQIRTFEPVSHEAAFTDSVIVAEYALEGRRTPADFGFPDYHDEAYTSTPDGLTLRGWWMPAKDQAATRAVVFVHGRWSNRLKPMKYLPLLSEAGLDTTHAVFLPDFRNAGTSDRGETAMGWEYAEDLLSTLEHLHAAHGIDRVTIYAFSMGAMAAALATGSEAFRERLGQSGVVVEKMVLDSPLSNVAGTLSLRGERDGVPAALVRSALWRFNATVNGRLGEMRLGTLLARTTLPTLILQGEDDRATPAVLLREEIDALQPCRRDGVLPRRVARSPLHEPPSRPRVPRPCARFFEPFPLTRRRDR